MERLEPPASPGLVWDVADNLELQDRIFNRLKLMGVPTQTPGPLSGPLSNITWWHSGEADCGGAGANAILAFDDTLHPSSLEELEAIPIPTQTLILENGGSVILPAETYNLVAEEAIPAQIPPALADRRLVWDMDGLVEFAEAIVALFRNMGVAHREISPNLANSRNIRFDGRRFDNGFAPADWMAGTTGAAISSFDDLLAIANASPGGFGDYKTIRILSILDRASPYYLIPSALYHMLSQESERQREEEREEERTESGDEF